MADLIKTMNEGKPQQIVTISIDLFDVQVGAIPYTVPLLRKEGRVFAGGKVVLKERLDALTSGDEAKIDAWGNKYFDLADLCLTFEEQVKFQPDSPLLTGIRGVVETQDGLFVAIDAEYVARAVKDNDMTHFQVSSSETVKYGIGNNKKSETAKEVVLLKYVAPNYVELNANQFNSVNAMPFTREDMIIGSDMSKNEIIEIIRGEKVIHKAWGIYPAELVVPLVRELFSYNKQKYNYDANMGLYLASPPQNYAEMRAMCVFRLDGWSRLCGDDSFGVDYLRFLGVASGCAAGNEK